MRRAVGVAASVALVLAQQFGIARAAEPALAAAPNDLGAQLMLQLFGETSDSRASFDAAHGDRASESPLRELALEVRPALTKTEGSPAVAAAFGEESLSLDSLVANLPSGVRLGAQYTVPSSALHFTVASASSADAAVLMPTDQHFTVAYRPMPPQPAISPAPGTLAFMPPETQGLDFVPAAGQIGPLSVEGHSSGNEPADLPQLTLHDATYDAGASFGVRAGKRNLNVNLSSEFQQSGSGLDSFSTSPTATNPLTLSGGAPLFLPNSTDLNRLSVGAGVSVPVVRGLTLNLNYDAQRLSGAYGVPGLVNLDTISNTYGGKLTFNIPQISSSLSIGAYQDRFQDSILPINGQTQTREDVNFTVKF